MGLNKLLGILLLLILTQVARAAHFNFQCGATHNLSPIFNVELKLEEGEQNKLFATYQEFEFYLSHLNSGDIELQVYNGYGPTRLYATTHVQQSGDLVMLSYWGREILWEVKCELSGMN
jgi:hypothetical protein